MSGRVEQRAAKDDIVLSPIEQAIGFLREELDLPGAGDNLPFENTPLFLGHGTEDNKVPLRQGEQAASCLQALRMKVNLRTYGGLRHWYSGEMLAHTVSFVRESLTLQ